MMSVTDSEFNNSNNSTNSTNNSVNNVTGTIITTTSSVTIANNTSVIDTSTITISTTSTITSTTSITSATSTSSTDSETAASIISNSNSNIDNNNSKNINTPSVWGQNVNWNNNDNKTNQRLAISKNKDENEQPNKICGSWARAVSGDSSSIITQNKNLSTSKNDENKETESQNTNNFSSNFLGFDNSFKADLYSTNWGKSVINHDNNWDLSPSDAIDKSKTASNEPTKNINSGTELWETNIRQAKGSTNLTQSLSQNVQQMMQLHKQGNQDISQWQSLSSAHIGGTWGEEEDLTNVWTGVPNTTVESNSSNSSCSNTLKKTNNFNSINNYCDKIFQFSANENFNNKNWISKPSNIKTSSGWNSEENQWYENNKFLDCNTADVVQGSNNSSKKDNENRAVNYNLGQNSGWKGNESSKSTITENIDDGTSLWGNPQGQNKVLLWKDDKEKNQLRNNPNSQPVNSGQIIASSPGVLRLPNASNLSKESWKKYSNNNGFNNINNKSNYWVEGQDYDEMDASELSKLNLIESNTNWKKRANLTQNNWNDGQLVNINDWAKNKQKSISKEMFENNSQYRILVDMGFKAEDVENAMRNYNTNLEELIEDLRLNSIKETEVEVDKRKISTINSNASSLPQASNFNNDRNTSIVSPILQQQQHLQAQTQSQVSIQGLPSVNNILRNSAVKLSNSNSMPSEKQLAHLVQQIQLAVQSGHLNAQILNQPLGAQTITLINQLLQQIKTMQNLQVHLPNISSSLFHSAFNYTINQCKQKIANIQKQISVQQCLFFKQQQQQQHQQQQLFSASRPSNPSLNFTLLNNNTQNNLDFKSISDVSALTNDINNLQIAQQQNQSRLTQWKLSNIDKNDINLQVNIPNSNDFSRAPGSTKQSQQFVSSNSWTGLNNKENWQNKETSRLKDNSLSSSAPQTNNFNQLSNIDTSFEPTKQWKGAGQDSIYNCVPNKITGVTNANDNLNSSKTFDSNTWSFPITTSTINKNNVNKNWICNNQSELDIWNNNNNQVPKNKGPPPGLGQIKNQKQNIWTTEETNFFENQKNSAFLLIQNLNSHIDGSTLKILCMQHGPLQLFHLFLNYGLALVKYNSKEEASKAQAALNNCVLGNTTILVSLPSESEVQKLLNCQQSNSAPANNEFIATNGTANNITTNWNNTAPSLPNANTNMWSFNQNPANIVNNLWNPIEQSNTNISLQNLLPGNLLGEST